MLIKLQVCLLSFNSIKVRLNQWWRYMRCRHLICFNSIKVRLNRLTCGRVEGLDTLFQFHKGTIKPGKHYDDQTLAHLFQFHKGTIKPRWDLLHLPHQQQFQFHKGTIKPRSWAVGRFLVLRFNSIKVRLNQLNNLIAKTNNEGFNSIKVRLNRCNCFWYSKARFVSIP